MISKLTLFLKTTTGKYILVGGSVYVLELLVIAIAQVMGAGSILAVAISFWVGLLASFFFQKLFTFGDKRMHRKILLPQLIAVTLLVIFNFGFTILVTKLLAGVIGTFGARTLALAITVIWNFYLYKTRIFKVGDEPLID